MSLTTQLDDGITALGIALLYETRILLLQYLTLIEKWNQVYNLTAIRGPETMLTQHVLDSLAILPHIVGPRIADVGSGAGLPGIPLALARPDCCVTLLESNHKRAAFLQQVRIELDLKNIEIVVERVENFCPVKKFDTVISRAFSSLAVFVKLAGHLCKKDNKNSRILAMKGAYPQEDLTRASTQFIVDRILPITVPGLGAERHIVVIKHL
ncbi:MAG: 16S rRNA (guanine(527)-N(7))-methyltransferase RsmG [Nitrosomonadaceae bacterium]